MFHVFLYSPNLKYTFGPDSLDVQTAQNFVVHIFRKRLHKKTSPWSLRRFAPESQVSSLLGLVVIICSNVILAFDSLRPLGKNVLVAGIITAALPPTIATALALMVLP